MLQSIPSTANSSEACIAGFRSAPIDPPQSKYIQILANANSIPFDPSIIQSIILSCYPFRNLPATNHGRCFTSWQQVGYAFWELEDSLTTRDDAWGAGTKSETCRPVDVGIQKSNYRHQIVDRDITKTMVFMRNLDIITEMESSQTCMWSILGDGGVAVLHSNHSNYPTDLFGQKSNDRHQIDDRDIRKTMVFMRDLDIITEIESSQTCMWSILGDGGVAVVHSNHSNYPAELCDDQLMDRASIEVNKTMAVHVLVGFTVVQPISWIIMAIGVWRSGRVSTKPCKKKCIGASTSTLRMDEKVESLDSLRSKRCVFKTMNVRLCASWTTWLLKILLILLVLSVVTMVVDRMEIITKTCRMFLTRKCSVRRSSLHVDRTRAKRPGTTVKINGPSNCLT